MLKMTVSGHSGPVLAAPGPVVAALPGKDFPETYVRDALEQLQARFQHETGLAGSTARHQCDHQEPSPEPGSWEPGSWELGPGSHPLADLRRLASIWRTQNPAHAGEDGSGVVTSPADTPDLPALVPGPAAMAAAAEQVGFECISEQRDVLALQAADFPLIALMNKGGSRLFLSLEPGGHYRLACHDNDRDQDRSIPPKALAAAATGAIFRLRPARPDAATISDAIDADVPVAQAPTLAHARGGRLIWRHLTRSMREQRGHLWQLITASLLINLFGMTLPLFSMVVFDRVIPHSAMETLWALGLGVAAALVLEFGLRNARLKLLDAVGQKTSQTLQGRAMGRLLHAPISALPGKSGAAVQPLQEIDQLSMMTPQLLVCLAVDIPFFFLLMALVASIGGPIVFAALAGTVALVALHALAHVMAHRITQTQGGLTRRLQQIAIDSLAAQERIRLTGASQRMLADWEHGVDEAGFAGHQARYWHGLAAQGSAVIVQLVVVAAIVIGVFLIDAAAMTIGALSACILLVNRSMMPVSQATGMSFRMAQILQSSGASGMILDMKAETGGDLRLAGEHDLSGQVDAQHVGFTYPGETRPALANVTFSIRPGERIGIIGKAGCGKSTLLRLIARLHEPEQGRLLLDHRDIRQFHPAMIRRAIGYMPQDTHLIDASLDDNLTLGLARVDKDWFARIVMICGVHAFASRHPSGYSLDVGPGGQRLSGGERQCVSLARALMGQPRLLMLDEPTSAMDNTMEARVIGDLKQVLGKTGLILATHRLAALELVDRIIWIEDGRIAADGPKAEVFRRFGLVQQPPSQTHGKAATG